MPRLSLAFAFFAVLVAPLFGATSEPVPGLVTPWEISAPVRLNPIEPERCPSAKALGSADWKPAAPDTLGVIDIAALHPNPPAGATRIYARTTLPATEAGPRAFTFGYRGDLAVYLNRQLVFHGHSHAPTGAPWTADTTISLPLSAGSNDLLVVATRGADGWAFSVRDRDAVFLHAGVTRAWELPDLGGLESVAFDAKRNVLFASNYAGNALARLNLDGRDVNLTWMSGFRRPTGVKVAQDRLYVIDRSGLSVIDPESAQVLSRTPIEGAGFANDLVVHPSGVVYVTDSARGTLYRLESGKAELWLADPRLAQCNGLALDGERLLVGVSSSGTIQRVDLATRQIATVATIGPGVIMDGLVGDGREGWLFSDYFGRVYRANAKGETTLLIDGRGPQRFCADFEFIPSLSLLVIPSLHEQRLTAYRLAPPALGATR
ncbi:SMP-30/gluconolactonase/LRE family protein [Opitutus sp. ER46]|uniref:SMP-30/gluconolactonase/LRE family protein n=1 Tax=Opitutus sp. ER46 TaxID=2161864 RepID=UPI000D2F5820|nr:SMP-30/gluconolactonase/LRE family protein [Opitutus sp. ER46]PTX94423.1 hypothetical protein DB354_11780 [Opitutus sp. ER46]